MSPVSAPSAPITPEQFLELPDRDRYELVRGELQEQVMSFEAGLVGGEIYARLRDYVRAHKLGAVVPDGVTYQCFPQEPGRIRRPDASFIEKGRLPDNQFSSGHVLVAPDLVVEVVSPNDLFYDVEEKVQEYLAAGVRLVWVASPKSRSIAVYAPDRPEVHLGPADELTGEDVVSGFRVPVSELFPAKADVL
jgi:Uma2 family endonuclease